MFVILKKLTFFSLIAFVLLNINFTYAAYITKKSDTSKAVERIEKEFANGNITRAECVKQKSKALKLEKVSDTICDNVEVKTVKRESKEKKKVEYIKKKEKKKKKAKKEFIKKTKKISKDAKSWITKKLKKEKHYKTIAQLPKSDFYFTAIDGEGNIFIGYINGDSNSKDIKVGNRKFKKISNGQAFQNDKKTQCRVRSEVDKSKNQDVYKGEVLIKCPNNIFHGIWRQTGNEGFGVAQSDAGIILDFRFSVNRNDAVASLNKKKNKSKTVKLEEKNLEIKDKTKPVISIAYNKKWYSSSKNKNEVTEVKFESDRKNYVVEGIVEDNEGVNQVKLLIGGRKIKIKGDGSFKIARNSDNSEEIYLYAHDASGNEAELLINVHISSKEFINDKKYYALIIGNNNYDHWDNLTSPINDVTEIAKILKEKYKFEIPKEFLLKNANKNSIEDAFFKMNEILTEDDYLLIYYAGHGEKNESIQKAYWIPTNAKKTFDRNWISTSFVTEMIGTFKAQHVLLMVDSCFAGLLKGNDDIESDPERDLESSAYFGKMLLRKARLYISSGDNEPVLDSADGTHSWFAKKFLDTLKANINSIDSEELYVKINQYVQANASQRPKYKVIEETGHNEGVFIFTSKN